MLNIGPQELIVVLIIALIVVGPQRLPELGRALGRALNEFRKIQDDVKDTLRFDLNADHDPAPEDEPTVRAPSDASVSPTTVGDLAVGDEPSSGNGSQAPDPATDPEPRASE